MFSAVLGGVFFSLNALGAFADCATGNCAQDVSLLLQTQQRLDKPSDRNKIHEALLHAKEHAERQAVAKRGKMVAAAKKVSSGSTTATKDAAAAMARKSHETRAASASASTSTAASTSPAASASPPVSTSPLMSHMAPSSLSATTPASASPAVSASSATPASPAVSASLAASSPAATGSETRKRRTKAVHAKRASRRHKDRRKHVHAHPHALIPAAIDDNTRTPEMKVSVRDAHPVNKTQQRLLDQAKLREAGQV